MHSVGDLVIGAGVSGLAMAAFLRRPDCLVLEADSEIGGYCKTIVKDGFTWDYSGHFFHFRHPDVEAWLRARMPGQEVRTIAKRAFISYADRMIDFPFQKNIHQLPQADFIECLHDLYFAAQAPQATEPNLKAMLCSRFGRGIADRFLIPYNQKLYACDLAELDADAMGRFFPHADLAAVIRNMRTPDNSSYNSTFTYPAGGAIQYVKALASELEPSQICVGEALESLDIEQRVARTNRRSIRYQRLVSTMPFPALAAMSGLAHDASVFSANQVLVLNLGFDRKGARDVHWVYYPEPAISFYRVGYYDNIFDDERLSIYVEVSFAQGAAIDVQRARERVLADLRRVGVIGAEHRLLAEHHVVLSPAYVHVSRAATAEQQRLARELRARGVYSIGRYGGWTYCSIEDNIVEARALAQSLIEP